MQRGRTKTAAFAIAKVWQDFPDLENEAPLVDRQARVRQRTQALRPLFDKIAEAQNRVQEAKNFAFIAQKIAEGTASSTDILIDQAKAAYAYSWPEAVQYAQGRYAAQHGWPYRQPLTTLTGSTPAPHIAAYDRGFSDGGGNIDDLFDEARRKNARPPIEEPIEIPNQAMLPSQWDQPHDAPLPARWSKRAIIIDSEEHSLPDLIAQYDDPVSQGLIVVTVNDNGAISIDGEPLDTPMELRLRLAERDIVDILIAARNQRFAMLDTMANIFPIARTMERLKHTDALRARQLHTWLRRGLGEGQQRAAGHIRWGSAVAGLHGALGEFRARYDGKAMPKGHRIIIEVRGEPAQGYFCAAGKPLDPVIVISNKSRLRSEMEHALRSFAASLTLPLFPN